MSSAPTNVLFIGNLDGSINRRTIYELGCQAGPVVSVNVPTGEGGKNRGYAFVEYGDIESATYAIRLFEGVVRMHGRALRFDYGKATGKSMAGVAELTPASAEAAARAAAERQQEQQQQQQQQASGAPGSLHPAGPSQYEPQPPPLPAGPPPPPPSAQQACTPPPWGTGSGGYGYQQQPGYTGGYGQHQAQMGMQGGPPYYQQQPAQQHQQQPMMQQQPYQPYQQQQHYTQGGQPPWQGPY